MAPAAREIVVHGIRHRRVAVRKLGLPVFNRPVRTHEEPEGAVRISGRLTIPPLEPADWDLGPGQAMEFARREVGATRLRGAPRIERGWLAGATGSVPVWKVTLPASRPFGTWQVVLDARTSRVYSEVDLTRRATGLVYDPNVAVAPVPVEVPLFDLDGSGHLVGRIVRALDVRFPLAFRPDQRFLFPPGDPRFVQTSVYRGLTDAGRFIEAHGFPAFAASIPAYANVVHPDSGDEFNNAIYDPFFPLFAFGNGDGIVTANLGTDLDVAAHEMGHHLFEVMVRPVFFAIDDPVLAMAEGVSDTIAALVAGDPDIGESTIPGAPYLRTLMNARHFPEDVVAEPHETGLIYGGVNWDLIGMIGAEPFADLLVAGLPFLPPDPFIIDYREALLEGDRVANGGRNLGRIRTAFSLRGFDSAELPSEFRGLLEVGVPVDDSLGNGEFHIWVFPEFPGSRGLTFSTTGTGDADLIVAPLSDPNNFTVSEGATTTEQVSLNPFTVPSVDDDDAWLVVVADFPDDFRASTYRLTASQVLPAPAIRVDGPAHVGSLDETGEVDFLTFTGMAGWVVRLEADALDPTLDPLVGVVDVGAGEILGADDDGGPGPNSLIQGARLPRTDTYAIVVLSSLADVDPVVGTGRYELRLSLCANTGLDTDGDGLVDACDDDDDDDGFDDDLDTNPGDPNLCFDLDLDGCDDCTRGLFDPFADGPDSDGDGICDAGDPDDDNDGCPDIEDPAPESSSLDDDLDFIGEDCDNCPFVPNTAQIDRDGSGIGDLCQCGDVDRDGFTNTVDALRIARGQVGSLDPGFAHCDVDGNGRCDTADALRIARGQVGSSPSEQRCAAWGAPRSASRP